MGVGWRVFTRRPERYDERPARLFAAPEEARTLIERRAAITAASRALLAEAEAALAARRARRDLTGGERSATDA